ncbi:olfactory receptor 52E8-like [Xenopus laevis]|uniref:Olfactory receptor n=1 Tax=Xenopus laevis TaxID=8355 RepID=A0A8J1M627_XENLA|nr:olfactory receptor 52E8-like [Xenopus laevis]
MANQSAVSEFVLIGFPGLQQSFHIPVSITMFMVYSISLIANSIVLILIILKRTLHHPMYIIIGNLAFSDLLFDTMTLPKIIAKYWFDAGSISYYACIFQLFCVHYLGTIDSFIIMLMAIDRYAAICKPLRYHSIITNRLVVILCNLFWIITIFIVSPIAVTTAQLPYCGPKTIRNCFCSNISLTALACADNSFAVQLGYIAAMLVLLLPLAIIILSYILIIWAVHSLSREENWQKAFYTCTTHLFVIALFYIPRVFVYTSAQLRLILNPDINVLLLCLYTFIPHAANPIIYCLRTNEIKDILKRTFQIRFCITIKQKSPGLQ